jgi:uncharacterized coiled-coil protein SlyX
MLENINPVIIFAALAIIFAVLNLALWSMVWKNTGKKSAASSAGGINRDTVEEIKGAINSAGENNSKIEDQLWGILDKLKDIEEQSSSAKAGEIPPEITKQLKIAQDLSSKSAALLKEEIKQVKEIREDIKTLSEKVKGMKNLNEMFETLDGSLANLNSRIQKLD